MRFIPGCIIGLLLLCVLHGGGITGRTLVLLAFPAGAIGGVIGQLLIDSIIRQQVKQ